MSETAGSVAEELDKLPPVSLPTIEGQRPSLVGYDPEPRRELLRGVLAASLVGLIFTVVLGSFLSIALHWADAADLRQILDVLFPPVIALCGTALGFYFGGKSH